MNAPLAGVACPPYTQLVLVTKYRHKVSDGGHLTRLEKIMRTVCAEFGTELIEFNGEGEHVHLQVNFPSKTPFRSWPTAQRVFSQRMRQEFVSLARHHYQTNKL
ncbi:transposase [Micromonospora coxensis]|uniref:transposase n=1 Tax=Micromonospora coxensis TaxID=356852 RepID=UPI00341FD9C5